MNTTSIAEPIQADCSHLAGRYLTFLLGQQSYGISVLKIREIIRRTDITPVPQLPDYVQGVINLRGKIVPVVNLHVKFGRTEIPDSERSCVVVVQVQGRRGNSIHIGLMVDAVEEVANLTAGEIELPPDLGAPLSTECILGMAKVKHTVKTLLDIDRVISSRSLELLQQATHDDSPNLRPATA